MRTNRYINSLVALIVTALLVLISCKEEEETVSATISLSEEVISLIAGTEQTLTATVTPSGSEIVWFSNKTHVATVDGGIVKAIDEGNAKIVAKSGNSTAICEVIVTKVAVPVTGIALNKAELEMKEGDMERLTATLEPYEATDRRVTWNSSDENVVSVQPNGTLIAHTLGEAVITVTTLDGNHTATCSVAVVGTIELLAPSNNTNITLHPTDPEKKVSFSWRNVEGIDKYILKISTSDLFEENDIVYTSETEETSLDVLEYTLNEAIKEIDGNSVPLYWVIFSGTEGIKVLPESRRLNLIPDRREYLRLSTGSATGMQLQKMAGEYHYSITTNGHASVNTVGLTKDIPVDSGTFVVQYKSSQALPSLTLNFKKQDGTVSGSTGQAVIASTDWEELRILQTELPAGWGNAGDYIELDFGNVSGYQIELNAINLQKGVYIPEILTVTSTGTVDILAQEDNYIKFKVKEHATETTEQSPHKTDPTLWMYFSRPLPLSATLVSLEYKSDEGLKWGGSWYNNGAPDQPIYDRFEVYLGPFDFFNWERFPNAWAPEEATPATNEWREITIDILQRRSENPLWGQAGHGLRIDPGNYTIGMTMEIRNIQVKSPN